MEVAETGSSITESNQVVQMPRISHLSADMNTRHAGLRQSLQIAEPGSPSSPTVSFPGS